MVINGQKVTGTTTKFKIARASISSSKYTEHLEQVVSSTRENKQMSFYSILFDDNYTYEFFYDNSFPIGSDGKCRSFTMGAFPIKKLGKKESKEILSAQGKKYTGRAYPHW